MFLTEVGISSLDTADPPVANAPSVAVRSLDSFRSVAPALATIARRLLAVAAVFGVSLLLHVVALVIAEQTYAPYRVSRSGEYVRISATVGVDARGFATAASSQQRLPRRP